jgi:hypothetical protein
MVFLEVSRKGQSERRYVSNSGDVPEPSGIVSPPAIGPFTRRDPQDKEKYRSHATPVDRPTAPSPSKGIGRLRFSVYLIGLRQELHG